MSNVKHSSSSVEHYTPPEIVEPARELMGGIDLDPASSEFANTQLVHADRIFTIKTDGFNKKWSGLVFLNPPGGLCDVHGRRVIRKSAAHPLPCTVTGECGLRPGHAHEGVTSSAKAWWWKLVREWYEGRVDQAFFVGFSLELLQATQVNVPDELPIPLMFPRCYPRERIKFLIQSKRKLVPGEQPTHANVLIYLPDRWEALHKRRMKTLFEDIGHVELPVKRPNRLSDG